MRLVPPFVSGLLIRAVFASARNRGRFYCHNDRVRGMRDLLVGSVKCRA